MCPYITLINYFCFRFLAIVECQFGGVPRYIRYCTLYRDQRNSQSRDARQYDLMKSLRDITIRVNLFYVNMFDYTPRQRTLILIAVMRAAHDLGRHFAANNVRPQHDQDAETAIAAAGDPADPNTFCHSMDGMAGIWDRVAMGRIPIGNYPYTWENAHQHRADEEAIVNNVYGNFQLPVPDFPYPSSLSLDPSGWAYLVQTPSDEDVLGFPQPSPRLQRLMPPRSRSSDRRRSGEESTDTEAANLTRAKLRLGETPPQSRPIGPKLIAMAGYVPASPAAVMPAGVRPPRRVTSTVTSASASEGAGARPPRRATSTVTSASASESAEDPPVAPSSRARTAESSAAAGSVVYDRTRDIDRHRQRQAELDNLRPSYQRPQYYTMMVQSSGNKRQKVGDGGDGDGPEEPKRPKTPDRDTGAAIPGPAGEPTVKSEVVVPTHSSLYYVQQGMDIRPIMARGPIPAGAEDDYIPERTPAGCLSERKQRAKRYEGDPAKLLKEQKFNEHDLYVMRHIAPDEYGEELNEFAHVREATPSASATGLTASLQHRQTCYNASAHVLCRVYTTIVYHARYPDRPIPPPVIPDVLQDAPPWPRATVLPQRPNVTGDEQADSAASWRFLCILTQYRRDSKAQEFDWGRRDRHHSRLMLFVLYGITPLFPEHLQFTLEEVLNATDWYVFAQIECHDPVTRNKTVRGNLGGSLEVPAFHLRHLEEWYEAEAIVFRMQIYVHQSLDLVPNTRVYAELHPGRLHKYVRQLYPDRRNYVFMNSFTSQRFETPYKFIDLAGIQFASGQPHVDYPAEGENEDLEVNDDDEEVDTPNSADEDTRGGQFDDPDDEPPTGGSAGAVALTVAHSSPDEGDDTPHSYAEDIDVVHSEAVVHTDLADDDDLFSPESQYEDEDKTDTQYPVAEDEETLDSTTNTNELLRSPALQTDVTSGNFAISYRGDDQCSEAIHEDTESPPDSPESQYGEIGEDYSIPHTITARDDRSTSATPYLPSRTTTTLPPFEGFDVTASPAIIEPPTRVAPDALAEFSLTDLQREITRRDQMQGRTQPATTVVGRGIINLARGLPPGRGSPTRPAPEPTSPGNR